MEDESKGLLGSLKTMSNISKYTKYLEDQQSLFSNWGKFATLFVVGILLIMLSLPMATFMLINPRPFCMLFSLGSLIILMALMQITQAS